MATTLSSPAAEGEKSSSTPVSHLRLLIDRPLITPSVLSHPYPGSGTPSSPYLVSWPPADPRNALNYTPAKKWLITLLASLSCLAVAFCSSAYTGGLGAIASAFSISPTAATLGVSLFVLGFAVGPVVWAPLSELHGRQPLFATTYAGLIAFAVGGAVARSAAQLLVCRFLAGVLGSSVLTNAGGLIADMFEADQRGLAMSLFTAGPFLGPALGPVAGGFLGEAAGWRWIMWLMVLFCAVLYVACLVAIPETYGPVLLRIRARELSRRTGKTYVSALENNPIARKKTVGEMVQMALLRPWVMLFKEPIVLILSIYMAIVYGTIYMFFAAYPIIFRQGRGWSVGMSGLAFVGLAIGMLFAFAWMMYENTLYTRRARASPDGRAPPEARLRPAIVAAVVTPVGLFWFAWTNGPDIHWAVCLAGSIPIGFGNVLLSLSTINYLIDSYVIYAASVLAASSILRSVIGAAFPLFTAKMYAKLGIHWASSVPAFLALACMPFPWLFYKYGAAIRAKCKYAAEAQEVLERMTKRRTDDESV